MDALDDYGFSDSTDSTKLRVINATIWDVLSRQPFKFLEKQITLTFSGSSGTPANVPADYHAALFAKYNYGGAAQSGGRLEHQDFDTWLRLHGNDQETGPTRLWYDIAGAPVFWPAPDASDTVTFFYVAKQAALDATGVEADIVIPPEFHDAVIVQGAVYRLDNMEDDTDLSVTFKQEYEQAIQNLVEWDGHRQFADPNYVIPAREQTYYLLG